MVTELTSHLLPQKFLTFLNSKQHLPVREVLHLMSPVIKDPHHLEAATSGPLHFVLNLLSLGGEKSNYMNNK